ncbi:GlcG/HbpS family heme-binding protein [Pseudomonas sp. LRF_L74]|uniref:GlcG/HbpS family heme-binding protein n=1 Tax=Pseudomonas sp. LRF_L74 TaxID=3369422 RepID=UPI003F648AE2
MTATAIPAGLAVLRPVISLAAARRAIATAFDLARRDGWAVSVAVVDPAGELVAFERDDDSAGVTPQVAIAKARSAALLRAPSKLFEDFVNGGLPSFLSTPGVTPLQGGVPITLAGQVIGAIGVSGAKGDDDERMASQAAATISQ